MGRRVDSVEEIVKSIEKTINGREANNGYLRSINKFEIKATIRSIKITGHGDPAEFYGPKAARLTLDDLLPNKETNELSARAKSLMELRPLWSKNNNGITLAMCNTAQGKEGQEFLKELAFLTGAKVIGYDQRYEIRPTGNEWTATPDKKITSVDTGRKQYMQDKYSDRPLGAAIDAATPWGAAAAGLDLFERIIGTR